MGWTQDGKPLVGAVPASLLHGNLAKAAGAVFIGAGFNGHGMPVRAEAQLAAVASKVCKLVGKLAVARDLLLQLRDVVAVVQSPSAASR